MENTYFRHLFTRIKSGYVRNLNVYLLEYHGYIITLLFVIFMFKSLDMYINTMFEKKALSDESSVFKILYLSKEKIITRE